MAASPPARTLAHASRASLNIGSLVAVHHLQLGAAAQLCRILGKYSQNGFLLGFFQPENQLCYVLGEYLYELPHPSFPCDESFLREEELKCGNILPKSDGAWFEGD
jgi:hypothetical protein